MEVINDLVNPPIGVTSKLTRSLNHWSSNKFFDPSDRVPFFIEDLSSIELGHVYKWKLTTGQWILINMPFKVMDSDTGKLVRGLKSYKSCEPYVNGSLPDRHLKNPKSCIKNFRVSSEDFKIFRRRVLSIEGLLIKDEVDVEQLSQDIKSLSESIDDFNNRLLTFRHEASHVSSGKYYETEDMLTDVLQTYSDFRVEMSEILENSVQIALRIDKLSKETSKETEKVRVTEEYSPVSKKLVEFRSLQISRFEREAIHKQRVDVGKENQTEVPTFIRELSQEINELKAYYPCLSRLRVVSNNEIALDLTGVDITLNEDKVIVRGDPGALKAYMGDNESLDSEVGGRRVRSIIGVNKPKK
tara:strand:+ start:10398 stop:11468 length:1071 start_codon:yes stop_codon:yes gene_type:complete